MNRNTHQIYNKKGRKMKVSKEIKKIWQREYEHGDIALIAEQSGRDPRTISDAVKKGSCSPETFEAVNKFFLAKKQARLLKEEKTIEMFNKQS
jgi:hypothetical protein